MTRRHRLAAAALLALAAAGHLAYWYLPRERPASADTAAREWLSEPGWEIAAWIPFPHQNLARLEDRVGDLRGWLEGVAGREGRGGAMPSFGPFVVPPARALLLAASGSGRWRAELDVYPSIRLLARAAGAVARNPWLAGGPVRWGAQGRGSVSWSGSRWRFEGSSSAAAKSRLSGVEASGAPAPDGDAPCLALVRLGTPVGPLPAALYRVARDEASGRLEAIAGDPAPPPPALARLFAATAGEGPAGWLAEAGPGDDLRAIAIWDVASEVPGLPAMATFGRGEGAGFRLPTEDVARLFGRRLAEVESHGLRIRAFERETVERAAELAPDLAAVFLPATGGLAAAAAARPGALVARVRAAAGALEAVPFVGAEEARPLRQLERLLAPLEGCTGATLEVAAQGAGARLVPCS